ASAPARCWPSTTRTTCRPRRPRRWSAPATRWTRHRSTSSTRSSDRRARPTAPSPSHRTGAAMTAELGHFAIALALAVSVVLGALPMAGSFMRGTAGARLMAVAQPASHALFALTLLGFGCLIALFVNNDFTVSLVATHSNLHLPLHYRVAASWGSHEGSIVLWVLMLAGWTSAVALFSGSLPAVLRARILATMGLVAIGFLMFTLFTSNPFERLVPPPADGRDLNPLLQDPGMVFHPPLLYMGYVGLSVAFAFAVAGLLGGRFDAAWARWA